MNSQPEFQSTTALTPLPKSAAAATRMSGERLLARHDRHLEPEPAPSPGPTCSIAPRDRRELHRRAEARSVRPARRRTRCVASGPDASRSGARAGPGRSSGFSRMRSAGRPRDLGAVGHDRRFDELHLLARAHRARPHLERAERDRAQQLDRERGRPASAGPGSWRSMARARSAAGAPPCCAFGSHGPRASSVATKRSPSGRRRRDGRRSRECHRASLRARRATSA